MHLLAAQEQQPKYASYEKTKDAPARVKRSHFRDCSRRACQVEAPVGMVVQARRPEFPVSSRTAWRLSRGLGTSEQVGQGASEASDSGSMPRDFPARQVKISQGVCGWIPIANLSTEPRQDTPRLALQALTFQQSWQEPPPPPASPPPVEASEEDAKRLCEVSCPLLGSVLTIHVLCILTVAHRGCTR